MRQFHIQIRGPHGWIHNLHITAEDGGVAFEKAVDMLTHRDHQPRHSMKLWAIEEGELTKSGWMRKPVVSITPT